jgi:hypothetical protein
MATVHERVLVFLLRLGGVLTLSAFGAVFLPTAWMEACHAWLGLGPFPASTLVDYLTRSVACLYGAHGGLLLLLSGDVRRFRRIVRYVSIMDVVLGVLLPGIDLHAGLPWWWTLAEGPPLAVLGGIMLYLLRFVPEG